jgi:hypothetical protein
MFHQTTPLNHGLPTTALQWNTPGANRTGSDTARGGSIHFLSKSDKKPSSSKQLIPLVISKNPDYVKIMKGFNKIHNKQEDSLRWNIIEIQKDQVEALLQQNDCSKMYILQNSNLEIMHCKVLLTNIEKCRSYQPYLDEICTRQQH